MIFNSARQVIVFFVGSVVVLVGIAGLVLPVIPGLVVIPAGLAILATEFVWARRLLAQMKERAKKIVRVGQNNAQPDETKPTDRK